MVLLLASLEDFKFILQIVLWIAIPAILIATGIVYFMHYKKQKKESALRLKRLEATNSNFMATVQDDEMHPVPDLSYEGEQLIKKYRKEIKSTSAKYDLLKREFSRLEEKYMELMSNRKKERLQIGDGQQAGANEQALAYETKIAELEKALRANAEQSAEPANWEGLLKEKEEQLFQREMQLNELELELSRYTQQSTKLNAELNALRNEAGDSVATEAGELQRKMQQQIAEAERNYKKEITGLLLQIEKNNQEIIQLKTSHEQAIQQTRALRWAAPESGGDQAELFAQLKQLEEEKALLRSRLTEENYLQDLLQEKNEHINFLQLQLEQRIKNYRHLEQQHIVESETIKTMDELVQRSGKEMNHLKEVITEKDKDLIQKQELLENVNNDKREQEARLLAKSEELENLRQKEEELRRSNEHIGLVLTNNNKTIGSLNSQLLEQQQKTEELERKLEVSSQLLIKIYKELARSFGTNILNNLGQETIGERNMNSLVNKPGADTPPRVSYKEST